MTYMDNLPGPTVHELTPDLRDGSPDLAQWGEILIPHAAAARLMNCAVANIRHLMDGGRIERVYVLYGRSQVRLGVLPETARCLYIEQLFQDSLKTKTPLHESVNWLYKPSDIMSLLGISKVTFHRQTHAGKFHRELMPGGGYRYPHWGMPPDIANRLRKTIRTPNGDNT